MTSKSTPRHYTQIEKEIFLDLLKEYKDIIENKKSDSATLKDKETAWKQIEESYNSCHMVSQQRNTAQLKKWWSNLKQQQRLAKTKERQLRMGTGGVAEGEPAQLDAYKEIITPDYKVTAPTYFSSNMSEAELQTNEKAIRGETMEGQGVSGRFSTSGLKEESGNSSMLARELNDDMETLSKSPNNEGFMANGLTHHVRKRQRTSSSSSSLEFDLKAERVRLLIKHEDEIHKIKVAYVMEEMNEKRAHLKRMHDLEEAAVKKRYELEERAALAKAKIAEMELQRAMLRDSQLV